MKLYRGNCLEVMKKIPDKSIDMILTGPPYGTTSCPWDSVIDLRLMWGKVKRVMKKSKAFVFTSNQPFTSLLIMSNISMFKYCWVWDKGVSGSFANSKYNPLKTHEDICIFGNGRIFYSPQMRKRKKVKKIGSVNSISRQGGTEVKFNSEKLNKFKTYNEAFPKTVLPISPRSKKSDRGLHPTQKPVALMEYLIKTYTNEGETVLDFTMGSGSTGVACKNTNRDFIGIELDEKYFEIAKKRIKNTRLGLDVIYQR